MSLLLAMVVVDRKASVICYPFYYSSEKKNVWSLSFLFATVFFDVFIVQAVL